MFARVRESYLPSIMFPPRFLLGLKFDHGKKPAPRARRGIRSPLPQRALLASIATHQAAMLGWAPLCPSSTRDRRKKAGTVLAPPLVERGKGPNIKHLDQKIVKDDRRPCRQGKRPLERDEFRLRRILHFRSNWRIPLR